MVAHQLKISAVFVQQESLWAAQCLEYDIAAQAKTLPDLMQELQRVIIGHIVASEEIGMVPFDKVPPAPAKFWEIFSKSKTKLERDPEPFRVLDGPMRPFLPVQDFRVAELQPAS